MGILLGVLMCAGWLSASEGPLSLENCLDLALEQNPELLAAQQRQIAAEARIQQARAIPQLNLDYDSDMQEGVLDVGRPGETYLGLSTTVEFPGRRGLRVDIAHRESAEVGAELTTKYLDLVFDVKTAFFDLLLARTKLDYANQNVALVDTFADLATARFETGDVGKVEVLRAQVELAGARDTLHSAENSEQIAAARLALLIGNDPSEPILTQDDFPPPPELPDAETISRSAADSRPEVLAYRTALDREVLSEKQARRGRLPDLELGIANHRIDGEGSFWNVTVSVPIPLFQQQFKGEIAEARANQKVLQYELSYLQSQIALEVQASHRQAQTARERLDLYSDKLLDEAREVYEMYVFSYEQGEINGLELNAARLSLVTTYTDYAEAAYDYAVAVATLERAVGRKPEGLAK